MVNWSFYITLAQKRVFLTDIQAQGSIRIADGPQGVQSCAYVHSRIHGRKHTTVEFFRCRTHTQSLTAQGGNTPSMLSTIEKHCNSAGVLSHFYMKRSIYQDRLRTNIRKRWKQRRRDSIMRKRVRCALVKAQCMHTMRSHRNDSPCGLGRLYRSRLILPPLGPLPPRRSGEQRASSRGRPALRSPSRASPCVTKTLLGPPTPATCAAWRGTRVALKYNANVLSLNLSPLPGQRTDLRAQRMFNTKCKSFQNFGHARQRALPPRQR